MIGSLTVKVFPLRDKKKKKKNAAPSHQISWSITGPCFLSVQAAPIRPRVMLIFTLYLLHFDEVGDSGRIHGWIEERSDTLAKEENPVIGIATNKEDKQLNVVLLHQMLQIPD